MNKKDCEIVRVLNNISTINRLDNIAHRFLQLQADTMDNNVEEICMIIRGLVGERIAEIKKTKDAK